MIEYIGYVGVAYDDLDNCVGLPALVVKTENVRRADMNPRPVHGVYNGTVDKLPVKIRNKYILRNAVDGVGTEHTFIGFAPEDIVFVKR